MKDVVSLEKARGKKKLLEDTIDITTSAELAQVSSPVNLTSRYKQAMSNPEINVAKELRLTGIKKYQRYTSQVEIELDWLHDQIPAFAIFVRHLYRVYNNKKVTQNMSVK